MNLELLFRLYCIFVKVGSFTFGGGYAMIPLFHDELVRKYQLMNDSAFADIVAIAQITPGPVGINAATYAGYLQHGLTGAAVATLGLLTPSLIIISLVARYADRFRDSIIVKGIMSGIRPAVIGLIAAAVMFFAEMSIFTHKLPIDYLRDIICSRPAEFPGFGVSWQCSLIFAAAIFLSLKLKWSTIRILILCALLGAAIL
jgi:chromate transporter